MIVKRDIHKPIIPEVAAMGNYDLKDLELFCQYPKCKRKAVYGVQFTDNPDDDDPSGPIYHTCEKHQFLIEETIDDNHEYAILFALKRLTTWQKIKLIWTALKEGWSSI